MSVETLRYYERLGLLSRPARTEHGARRYGAEAIARVRFIRQAQGLGLTLREILELMGGTVGHTSVECRNVHALLTRHLEEIDRRTRELRALRSTLSDYRRACEQALNQEQDPRCPTIVALTKR